MADRVERDDSRVYRALKQALRESGCDGDLCMHNWHEEARSAIEEYESAALALPAQPPPRSQAQVVGWSTAKTWDDYENNAKATYGGGYRDGHEVDIFHHGMQTIFNLLRAEFPEAHECLALRSGASATPAPSELPKMGPGDYSCATCGMGMVEPCIHWKESAEAYAKLGPSATTGTDEIE